MAEIWQRDGVKLTLGRDGKVAVEIDLGALTAASELDPVGTVRVYDIDPEALGRNIAKEAGRLVRRIQKAAKRGKR